MNYIQEYYQAIESGQIVTSRRVRAVYARLAAATEDTTGRYVFDEARGERPIEFMERFCCHSKGEWAGQPVVLELFQRAYVQALFGFVDRKTGLRQYRESFFLCGRKNGKTTLLSGIGLYMLTSDGEGGAQIVNVATKRDQARLLFDEALNMVKQSPALSKHVKKRKYDMLYKPSMSTFQTLSSRSGTQDGLNIHLGIIDEVHAITDVNQYDVLRQAMGARRQPLLICITTAGTVRESVYDDLYRRACQAADGVIEDPTFLPILYELDDRAEWEHPETWMKANPSLGSIKKLDDLAEEVETAKRDKTKLSALLTKQFNIRETSSSAWLSFTDINSTETFSLEDFRGAYIIGSCDLSRTTDLTCATILMMRKGDERKYVHQMYWLPHDRLEEHIKSDKIPYDRWMERGFLRLCQGNTIDYSDVTAWFLEVVQKYQFYPAWVYYDSWSARYFVEEMESEGFTMVPCIQGPKTLSIPMQLLGADLQKHLVVYNNNPMTKWCLSNVGVKEDRNGNIVPIKNTSDKQRIDGAAALLDAYVGLYAHLQEYQGLLK